MARITSRTANSILHSKLNLFRIAKNLGWYIPDPDSKAVTTEFLFRTQIGTIFRIEASKINPYREELIKRKKIDLYIYLKEELLGGQELGYDSTRLPSRKYLLNIIHSLKSDSEIFTGVEINEKIVEVPLA